MDRRTFIQTTCAAAGALTLTDVTASAQTAASSLEKAFRNPPDDAGLSIVYHWTGGAVTKEGITADMEGIAASGIRVVNWFYFDGTGPTNAEGIPTPTCLTAEWWGYVEHLMREAKRLSLVVAPHVCSSWGPAGAPDITPELSQQQLVWSDKDVQGGQPFTGILPKPERPPTAARSGRGGPSFPPTWRGYYRDLAVLAFPVPKGWGETSLTAKAAVTATLPIADLVKAADPNNNERIVSTDKAGWIQFTFDAPFTLRAVTMNPGVALSGPGGGGAPMNAANPYRVAHSLEVQASDDGVTFRKIGQLNPMGNGWQTRGVNALTHTVTETTSRHFRLVYAPGPPLGYDEGMRTGTRTGGGDFQNMVEPLGFASVLLSSTPTVHHLPCKNMTTWGWSRLATDAETSASACVPLSSIVDLTQKLQEDGTIENWTPPGPGTWKVQRIGYTTQLSSTGGGLHCDKLSADAARVVFDSWFGEFKKRIPGSDTLIPILNIDSWEGGSQNWSPVLPREFRTRRGYDVTRYLPCMTGVVVESPSTTEGFLLDLRRTISECISENHYGTMSRLAHEHGAIVMSEAVNPAIAVDGMEYARYADWIGSEFWVRAGQNWKPNDVRDATAGARIYGKKIHFSEAFTGGGWQDHPFALKAMGDHHYTEGINRMMLHVWNEQYVPTRAPGVPGAGTPFNHTNTWWKAGQPWRDYMKKAQALLQEGDPVSDILYFAGENIPCRSLLHPKHGSAWAADPAPPDGFMHDTINRDGLLRLTTVRNGRIVVNGALNYRVLVLRANEPYLTPKVAAKLKELVEAGAVVVGPRPTCSPSLELAAAGQEAVKQVAAQVWGNIDGKTVTENRVGKGRVFWGKPLKDVLAAIGVAPDVEFNRFVATATGKPILVTMSSPTGTNPVLVGAERKGWGMEYLHKMGKDFEFYFLSNQEYVSVSTEVSFRVTGRIPELWYADSGRIVEAPVWREQGGRTIVPLDFDPAGSVFVVFRKAATGADPVVAVSGATGLRLQQTAAGLETWASANGEWTLKTKAGRSLPLKASSVPPPLVLTGPWNVMFPLKDKSKQFDLEAGSWANHGDEDVKYFSGTATYRKSFTVPAMRKAAGQRLLLDLGDVQNLARVRLNGKDLGVLWKAPYVIDVTAATVAGANQIEIEVTNTWFNRLAGDVGKPTEQRVTWAGAGGRGFGGGGGGAAAAVPAPPPLLPAGLIGPVRVVSEIKVSSQGLASLLPDASGPASARMRRVTERVGTGGEQCPFEDGGDSPQRCFLLSSLARSASHYTCEVVPDSSELQGSSDNLERGFKDPPASAAPRVWWHWMNGNVTKDGITADLEWMKRVGIGGVQNFDAALSTPQVVEKRLAFMTPEWKDAFAHAVALADTLGLEFAIAGSPGWSESGGPWVTPEHAMKKVVWSETRIEGGKPFTGRLAAPPAVAGPFQGAPRYSVPAGRVQTPAPDFYRDAAVVAFAAPTGDMSMAELKPAFSIGGAAVAAGTLWDGDFTTGLPVPVVPGGAPTALDIDLGGPQTIHALSLALGPTGPVSYVIVDGPALLASDDGRQFRAVAVVPRGGRIPQYTVSFAPVTARYLRLAFSSPAPGPAPARESGAPAASPPEPVTRYLVTEMAVHTAPRVNRFEDKAGFASMPGLATFATPAAPANGVIPRDGVIDLTSRMRPDGTLDWTPPAGRWTVLRVGYSLTGKENSPASAEATGLEVDKLNGPAVKAYFTTYLDMYRDAAKGLMGKRGLGYVIMDSWEARAQNWTDAMIAEFTKRRGYDMRPWLPVLTGRVVQSSDASDKFLWDLRATIGELTVEHHYDQLTTLLRERGMGRYTESHEVRRAFTGDGMEVKRTADVPMSAMWTGRGGPLGVPPIFAADIRESASVAHIYGQNIVAAESLTAGSGAYTFSPENLKATADAELSQGLNRFVIHTSVHQPLTDRPPGQGLGRYGQWFTRLETWAEQAGPWVTYLSRSSYMLQQGRFAADVLYYYGDDSNITALFGEQAPDVPAGYNFDYANSDVVLNRVSVANGRLTTATGMRYRLLALDANAKLMQLPVLRKIRDLVDAGAVVVGPKPLKSPRLMDDGAEFTVIVDRMWGTGKGVRAVGAGKVYADVTVAEAMAGEQVAPDFEHTKPRPDTALLFVHRTLPDGEIYWVNNRQPRVESVDATFRVTGKAPEIWHADTGLIERAAYRVQDGRTIVPLRLEVDDAVFVVFRKISSVPSRVVPDRAHTPLATIDGPWAVAFQASRGAPATATFPSLTSWSEHADRGVKYFSGTATYAKSVDAPAGWFGNEAQIWLDLGEVKNMAEVTVNGRKLPLVWKQPFRVNATGALRPGPNAVEIAVTNLWVNRIVGDLQADATRQYTYTPMAFYTATSPLLPSGLLGPVRVIKVSTR